MMSDKSAIPSAIFDHTLWCVRTSDGAAGRARVSIGECLFLFTSLDAAYAYLDFCLGPDSREARPAVFSRNRRQFGAMAREAAADGIVGALMDPRPQEGVAPFLRFRPATFRDAS